MSEVPSSGTSDLPVRELLRLSQTDQTPDPGLGLVYAIAAYEKAQDHTVAALDPTAAGEAAAKAGFRTAQNGQPFQDFSRWFDRSLGSLRDDGLNTHNSRFLRERIATHLLYGRSVSLSLLKGTFGPVAQPRDMVVMGRTQFGLGEDILKRQHKRGHSWDPYATMLARHWATHEAVSGSAFDGAKLATRGIWRAVRSSQETANTPRNPLQHGKFIVKQTVNNAAAGALAATQPLDRLPVVKKLRHRMALALLG